jgi:hypothetical protein
MNTVDSMTKIVTADDPVIKAMQEFHCALYSTAQAFGLRAALEGLANILIINLAAAYGEKAAMTILGEIAATATPIARRWSAIAAAADHEPGHA